ELTVSLSDQHKCTINIVANSSHLSLPRYRHDKTNIGHIMLLPCLEHFVRDWATEEDEEIEHESARREGKDL
ncbi:hypothetical protein POSPLADRAFT_1134640, partial [Postia placenta MAD-698-R-SB12]